MSQLINVAWRTCEINDKDIYSSFMKARNPWFFYEETCRLKKKNHRMVEMFLFLKKKLFLIDLGYSDLSQNNNYDNYGQLSIE